jgi:outer membrane lipoprotein-sorting protein
MMTRVFSKTAIVIAALTLLTATRSWSGTRDSLPSAEDIVARMVRRDADRRAVFSGYTALRQYEVANKYRHAEMLVRVDCTPDGTKEFSILREEGSQAIRNNVLQKMLQEETNASLTERREDTRITPANYSFELLGTEILDGRLAYILEITSKSKNKYLLHGRIWVDAAEYAITRIEGSPVQNPSFWTKSVHFVRTYEKVGNTWLAASTRSVADVRIFGTAEVSIKEFDHSPRLAIAHSQDPPSEARLTR